MSDFYKKVYNITRKIPYGRVTTYGAIARFVGSPQSSKMVGWALNKCYLETEFVPAHRVVNRNGILTGKKHFGGFDTMIQLLENEGIHVIENKIQNFEIVFWEPVDIV